jgi:lipoate-protein ligase B
MHLTAFILLLPITVSCGKTLVRLIDLSHLKVPYKKGLEWQKKLIDYHLDLQDQTQSDIDPIAGHVILLQHESVYTLGSATTVTFSVLSAYIEFSALYFTNTIISFSGRLVKN